MLWTTFTLPHRSAYAAPIAAGPALCRVDLPPCDCGAEYGVIVTDGLPPLQEAVDGHQRSARAPQTSLRVDSRTLPDGLDPRFEVMASDGVLTSSDISVRGLEVPMKPPRVSIATPAARVQFTADRPITFVGAAADLQDGSLPASALVWRSSLDGVIGRGPSITATLKPATHVITLTGTNRAGLSATATITVTVTAVPPVVVASIVP
jgi:hypothetical protein